MMYPAEDFANVLLQACQFYADVLTRYCELWLRDELGDEEADEMASIYTKAESNPLLDFLITSFDEILSERVGLFDEEFIQSYKNQQAWLREHLEQVSLEQDSLIATQTFLKKAGFYKGAVDGVWGSCSRTAITKYRTTVQQLLRKKGLYKGNIDGELGQQSVNAVQTFQSKHNLSKDGVPGEKTFAALQD